MEDDITTCGTREDAWEATTASLVGGLAEGLLDLDVLNLFALTFCVISFEKYELVIILQFFILIYR